VRLHRAIYEVTHDADRTEHSAAAIAACTSGPPETTYHRGLARTIAPYRETVNAVLVHLDVTRPFEKVIDAIRATPAETQEDLADLEEDTAMTRRALDLLGPARRMPRRGADRAARGQAPLVGGGGALPRPR
jgi:hypothetical protein